MAKYNFSISTDYDKEISRVLDSINTDNKYVCHGMSGRYVVKNKLTVIKMVRTACKDAILTGREPTLVEIKYLVESIQMNV